MAYTIIYYFLLLVFQYERLPCVVTAYQLILSLARSVPADTSEEWEEAGRVGGVSVTSQQRTGISSFFLGGGRRDIRGAVLAGVVMRPVH